jgi:hypothetical protein
VRREKRNHTLLEYIVNSETCTPPIAAARHHQNQRWPPSASFSCTLLQVLSSPHRSLYSPFIHSGRSWLLAWSTFQGDLAIEKRTNEDMASAAQQSTFVHRIRGYSTGSGPPNFFKNCQNACVACTLHGAGYQQFILFGHVCPFVVFFTCKFSVHAEFVPYSPVKGGTYVKPLLNDANVSFLFGQRRKIATKKARPETYYLLLLNSWSSCCLVETNENTFMPLCQMGIHYSRSPYTSAWLIWRGKNSQTGMR